MKAPTVQESMRVADATSKLQSALNELASIYTLIGCFTVADLAGSVSAKTLVDKYRAAEGIMKELSEDDIPF